jgi:Zn-dependent peptidase ImmA (M78 family)
MNRYNPWLDALQRYPAVHIEWHSIAPAHAIWVPGENVILVDEHISRAERRCALAHEIAHMDTGDRPTELCWFAARQETAADRVAARRLVDVEELASVIRWCRDPREIAEELEVTLSVLAMRGSMFHPAERGLIELALSCRDAVA